MSLTDLAIRKALPGEKPYKLSDGRGLFLFISTTGVRSWRLKYRFRGLEKLLTLGRYPEVKLADARANAEAARAVLRSGKDPSVSRLLKEAPSFEAVAREWHSLKADQWSPHHASDVLTSLEKEVFKALGSLDIDAVTVAEVLAVLRKIEKRGAIETAHRVRQRIEAIYAFAISSGTATSNPGAAVKAALKPKPRSTRQAAITDLPTTRQMLTDALEANAQPVTRLALKLLALTAVRPGELRHARWTEFDEEATQPVWTIPADHMKGDKERKAGEPHLVPLSPPAVDCVRELRRLTGSGRLAFPSLWHAHKPMSENAIGYLLNRAGYHGRQTAHGFRATFSSIMNEHFPADRAIIDLMLAHTPAGQSSSEGAYNRAQHMARRRELANEWAKLLLGTG